MNTEPPTSNEPERGSNPFLKVIWLLVALVPSLLILLVARGNIANGAGAGTQQFVAFGLNPVMTFIGCYGLTNSPGRSKVIPVLAGIFFGAVFAALNIVIGVLGGCAFGGRISP